MPDAATDLKLGATAAYTYAFCGTGMTVEDYLLSIRTLPALGLGYFDLEILQPQHIPIYEDKANAAALDAALAESGVKIAGFTAWACLELIHSDDPADHARGFELFARIAAIAQRFGAAYIHLGSDMIRQYIVDRDPAYVTAPALRVALPEDVRLDDVLDQYAQRLARLAGIAADHGLRFAFEPRANSLTSGPDAFNAIARRAGHSNLYACLDLVHLAYHREDPALALEKVGERLAVVQLCNARGGAMLHLPLDDGELRIDPVLATLVKLNFDGFVMLELYRSGNDAKADVDRWYRQGARDVAAAWPVTREAR